MKVIIAMGNVVIVAAALTYVLVEGTVMLAESFLKKREEEGRKKGIEQAYRHIAFMIGERPDLSDAEREKLLELLEHPPRHFPEHIAGRDGGNYEHGRRLIKKSP